KRLQPPVVPVCQPEVVKLHLNLSIRREVGVQQRKRSLPGGWAIDLSDSPLNFGSYRDYQVIEGINRLNDPPVERLPGLLNAHLSVESNLNRRRDRHS